MHIHTHIRIHIQLHLHLPACLEGGWGRGIHACIMSTNGRNNYKVEAFCMAGVAIIMTMARGSMAGRKGRGGMIAWAAAALSGLLLLICCIQSDRNYSPSHSNIYENSYFFYQNLCAFHARHVHAGGPKLEPLPVPPTAPLSPHSHSLSFSRQWPLAIIRRNKRQLTESN